MNYKKLMEFCIPFRIVLGTALISYGLCSNNYWFFLGVIPLIAGLTKFCPICKFSDKCKI